MFDAYFICRLPLKWW